MKELLISSLLGVAVLGLDLLRLRKAILPVILLGLGAILLSLIADWSIPQNPFSNHMLLMDQFALTAIGVLSLITLLWFALTSDGFASDSRRTDLYSLVLFSFAGAVILVSYTNMVMMFLGIEILSIPMYVLAASKKGNLLSNEAGFKYFFLGAVASAVLLFGIALVYGATGTFDFTELTAAITAGPASSSLLYAGVSLILAGFAFKASVAPFHFWAPDVYQGTPTTFTALMSSVVKGAAFLALYRLISGPLNSILGEYTNLLAIMAALTLVISNILAAVQTNVKRMLAYSGISHAGFLLAAVMIPGADGGNLLFYVLTYGLAAITSFAVLNTVSSYQEGSEEFTSFHGLVRRNPVLAGAMTLALLSMAGIPPLSGFMAKYLVISGTVQSGYLWLAIVMILTSVVGVYYYLRLIVAMFTPVENSGRIVLRGLQHFVYVLLSFLLVALFFGAGVFGA
jgi:NADH-quinone oxidoreductase subunit N